MIASPESETTVSPSVRQSGGVPAVWVSVNPTHGAVGPWILSSAYSLLGFLARVWRTEPILESVGFDDEPTGQQCLFCSYPALCAPGIHYQEAARALKATQATVRFQPTLSSTLSAEAPIKNDAVAAVTELQRWLSLSLEDVADLTGVSRSAILYWKRRNAHPRPGAARNLFRIHALVRAVAVAVRPQRPLEAFWQRNDSGSSAYELLSAGHYEEAEDLLRSTIFSGNRERVQHDRLIDWEDEARDNQPPGQASPELRTPLTRRHHRVSLSK